MSEENFLDRDDQHNLLWVARESIQVYLKQEDIFRIRSDRPRLQQKTGAFVTLKREDELRGCIGHLFSSDPLFATVRDVAIASATQDYRFHPVQLPELEGLDIEISVLTPFQAVKEIGEIEVGRHGLIVSLQGRRGLLLPQVATEYGWDRQTFLEQTCLKAGLPTEAWKDPRTAIESFSAQVFGEKSLNAKV